jgi:hypothetical protein
MFFVVRGTETQAGLNTHEDRDGNQNDKHQIGTNSLGITSSSTFSVILLIVGVLGKQIQSFMVSRFAVEGTNGLSNHDINDARDHGTPHLILSLPGVSISLEVTI